MEPPLTQMLNNYVLPVHLTEAFHGQSGTGDFNVDFRMTQTPIIEDGYMDMYMVGAFNYLYTEEVCEAAF